MELFTVSVAPDGVRLTFALPEDPFDRAAAVAYLARLPKGAVTGCIAQLTGHAWPAQQEAAEIASWLTEATKG